MAYRFIFFDTETTGTYADRDRIVEIAAYDPLRDKTFEELIHPGMPIPKEVIAIHKITDEMVQNAHNFAVVGQKFIDFCDDEVILIAHNNDSFDLPFLRAEMKRSNLNMPTHWLFLDSLKWARRYRKDLPRHSLQYLRQFFGIQENQAHRALNDVKVLHEVFLAMIDDLSPEVVYQLLTKNSVEQKSEVPAPLQQMPEQHAPLVLFS
ncbi:MAG: dnaq3 [Chlamydiia bacterium]|nr:dnaq3 [Chlamydiia bacterium]